MVDFLDTAGRAERMSKIRSRDTKPEIMLRKALHRLGLRYKLGGSGLPGKPDLIFPKHRAIVFVHGCFWHRHTGCKVATTPKSNTDFWIKKFQNNTKRDEHNEKILTRLGWRVFIVWECEIVVKSKIEQTVRSVYDNILNVD